MTVLVRGMICLALCLCGLPLASAARAGVLDRAGLERIFPAPLVVGEKDDTVPVWPILKQNAGTYDIVAYAFESIDLAPIPGFGGTPPNLLVALAPDGTFRDVRVLSQHEPVFVDGLGAGPLTAFVDQYAGLSMRHAIRVGRPGARAAGAAPASVVDGVSMATASTRVINETLLASALAVARAKLGFGAAASIGLKVTAKPDGFEPMDWNALLAGPYVQRLVLTNGDIDKAFAGTAVADGGGAKQDPFTAVTVAYLNVPSIGRNLLGARAFASLMRELGPADHAVLVAVAGPWTPLGDDFVLGSVPDAIAISQDGLVVNARDMAIERNGGGMAGLPPGAWTILKIGAESGFDPSRPWSLALKVTRAKGQILAEKVSRDFTVAYALPPALFVRDQPESGPTWIDSWRARALELAVLAGAIALLVPVLVFQQGLVAQGRRFAAFRIAYLAMTLGYIGWYAQAQLSIVTLVGLVRALTTTGDFRFLLYDPPSLLLWGFVLMTLVVWGRGTFCGWLCPFGALQDLLALPVRWFAIPQLRVPPRVDRGLRLVKYALLAGILLSAVLSTPLADALAEIEPFKTTITLRFIRTGPFLAYALLLLALNLVVYKGFCRYLCPLGASLALAGRVRVLDWIPRRAECGSPCQLCKVKCRYGAITPRGRVDYAECFQCMDCVTIIHDPAQCVPEILSRKRRTASDRTPERAEDLHGAL